MTSNITLHAQWIPLKQSETITYTKDKSENSWTKVSSGSLTVPTNKDTYSATVYEEDPDYYSSSNPKSNQAAVSSDETATITNTGITSTLTIENQVSGNAGSKDKPFEFTVEFTKDTSKPITGSLFEVDIDGTKQNLTLDSSNKVKLSLAKGQKATIHPIYNGTMYKITETSYSKEGYDTKSTTNASGMLSKNTTVTFTNSRAFTLPTGIRDHLKAITICTGAAAAGILAWIIIRKKRKKTVTKAE